jgi:hypothetical protein
MEKWERQKLWVTPESQEHLTQLRRVECCDVHVEFLR